VCERESDPPPQNRYDALQALLKQREAEFSGRAAISETSAISGGHGEQKDVEKDAMTEFERVVSRRHTAWRERARVPLP